MAQTASDVLTDDGFGAQIWAAADRGDITPAQAPLVVRSLLSAGVDTTVHGISAVLYAFASNRSTLALDDGALPGVVSGVRGPRCGERRGREQRRGPPTGPRCARSRR